METWQREIADIARRYDTTMAQAFCRALGVEPRRSRRRRDRVRTDRYAGMDECRRHRHGEAM